MFRIAVVLVVASILASPLIAQSRPHLEFAVGSATPRGELGLHRRTGPFIRAGMTFGDAKRIMRLRIDGEATAMRGRSSSSETSRASTGDLRVLGATVTHFFTGECACCTS